MNKFDLKNKIAIITGGAQGFGLDIAKKFLDFGAKVRLWDIDENELKKAQKEISSVNLEYDVVDVSNYKVVNNTVTNISKKSKIDILINTAGILHNSLFLMSTTSEIQKILNVNFTSQILLTQLIAKKMVLKKSGNIIFFSSSSAKENNFGRSIFM